MRHSVRIKLTIQVATDLVRQPLQPRRHATNGESYEGHNIKLETLVICWVGEACKQNVMLF